MTGSYNVVYIVLGLPHGPVQVFIQALVLQLTIFGSQEAVLKQCNLLDEQ